VDTPGIVALDADAGRVLKEEQSSLQSRLDQINSDLTNETKITKKSAVKGEKFTKGADYYLIGRICYISFETSPSSNVKNGDIVLTGVPKPLFTNYLSLQCTNGKCYSARIYANSSGTGTLEIYFPANTDPARIDTSFSYIIYK